jgi:hypothetical protein
MTSKREMADSFATRLATYQDQLGLGDQMLADLLEVDRPTIGRWKIGLNTPHQLMWPPIWRRLQAMLDATEGWGR